MDIYITNVAVNASVGDEVRRMTEEKTSFDLKQEFLKVFHQNREEYGEIARCYVTRSQGENWDTYIAFMSMKDTSTHHEIVEFYNGLKFRGRELVLRISSGDRRMRTTSSESSERVPKSILEELISKKVDLENQIEIERQKKIKERANADEEENLARLRKELEETKKEVERRKIADLEKEEDWSKRRSELEAARKEIDEREKNVSEREKEIIKKGKQVDEKVKVMKEEWVKESKKIKEEKIRLCHQLFKRESGIRLRELRVGMEELVKGPKTTEEFDVEAAKANKRSMRKSY